MREVQTAVHRDSRGTRRLRATSMLFLACGCCKQKHKRVS